MARHPYLLTITWPQGGGKQHLSFPTTKARMVATERAKAKGATVEEHDQLTLEEAS